MRRSTKFLILGATGLLAMLVVATLSLRRLHRRHTAPARYAATAERLAAAGQWAPAVDQYERALRHAKPGDVRARISFRYGELLLAGPPMAPDQGVRRLWTALNALDEAFRLLPQEPLLAQRLLTLRAETAQVMQQTSAWDKLAALAEQVARRFPEQEPVAANWRDWARFHLILAQGRDDTAVQRAWRDAIKAPRQQTPEDPKTAFAAAWLTTLEAEQMGAPRLTLQADKRYAEAVERMRAASENARADNPDALLFAAALLLEQSGARAKPALKTDALKLIHRAEPLVAIAPRPFDCAEVVRLRLVAALVGTAPCEDAAIQEALAAGEALLRQRLQTRPEEGETRVLLARVLRGQGRLREAQRVCDAVRQPRQVRPGLDALRLWVTQTQAVFELAQIRLIQTRLADSDPLRREAWRELPALLRELTSRGIGTAPLAILAGRLAFAREDWRRAATAFEKVTGPAGQPAPELSLFSGMALARMGETRAAADRIRRFLDSRVFSWQSRTAARLELAEQEFRNHDFIRTLAVARDAMTADPANRRARLLAADACLRQALFVDRNLNLPTKEKEITELLEPLVRAEDPAALRVHVEFKLATADRAASLTDLDTLVSRFPRDAELLILWCHAKTGAGQVTEMWQRLHELAASLPDNAALSLLQTVVQSEGKTAPLPLESCLRLALEPDPLQRELNLCRLFLAADRLVEARAALDRATAGSPDHPELLPLAFTLALFERDWRSAEESIAAAGKRWDKAEELAWRGRLELVRGDLAKADEQLSASLANWPFSSDNWTTLGQVYAATANWSKAEQAYRKALDLRPALAAALDGMFRVCDARGNSGQAMRYLEMAVLYGSVDHPRTGVYLDYLEQKRATAEAIGLRSLLAAARPWDQENRRALVRLYATGGKLPQAKTEIDRLLREAPGEPENHWMLADYFRLAGHPEQARESLLTFLIGRGPQATAAEWLRAADFLRSAGFTKEYAEALSKTATATDWLHAADFLRSAGFTKEYEVALRNAVALQDPKTMPATWRLAEWLIASGNPAAAVTAYRDLKEGTGDVRAIYGLANALLAIRQETEAEWELRAVPAPETGTVPYLCLAARVAAGLNRLPEAESRFKTALVLANPRIPEVDAVLTQLLTSVPATEQSAMLQRLSAPDPSGLATLHRARLLAAGDAPAAAIPLMSQLRSRLPDDAPVLDRLYLCLGATYHRLQQHREAKAAFAEAQKRVPDDPVALNNLAAELSEKFGEPAMALPLAEKAVRLATVRPDILPYCLDTLGYAQTQTGLPQEAEITLRRSLALKELPIARYHLGLLYLTRRKPDLAQAEFVMALALAESAGDKPLVTLIRNRLAASDVPPPGAKAARQAHPARGSAAE